MSERIRDVRSRMSKTYRKQLTPAGTVINTLEASVEHFVTLEDVLAPAYWFSQAYVLRPFDVVNVVWDDGSRIVALRCMGIDQKGKSVLMSVMSDVKFDAPDLPAGFVYDFENNAVGWRIFRVDDENRRFPLRSGFSSKLEAYAWFTGEHMPQPAPKQRAAAPPPPPASPKPGAKGGAKPEGGDGKEAA